MRAKKPLGWSTTSKLSLKQYFRDLLCLHNPGWSCFKSATFLAWCGRKVMRLATLCTNQQCCCLPLHLAVRLTPAVRLSTSLNLLQLPRDCWERLQWSCVCEVCYENGPAKVSAMMCQQSLCKAWQICYCDLWKVTKGLWWTFPIQGTSVQVAQFLFRRPRTSCGKNFNLKNGRQCGKSEVSCEVRSSIDVENDQQWIKFEPVYRPSNYNTGFGHENSVGKDGSKKPQN